MTYIKNNTELSDEYDALEKARKRVSNRLNIDLQLPKQEKRIEALTNLYKKYSEATDVRSFLYRDICDCYDRLSEIRKEQQLQLDDLKLLNESFSSLKIRLENIEYKYKVETEELEKKLLENKRFLSIYENKFANYEDIDIASRKKIKELEDKCWDNWLKALDVNKELRNTIIGFENRKALHAISSLYVDYHILANSEVSKCFNALKENKKEGIKRYYEILTWYQLPVEKRMDFKVFLQKMIESKFADSSELKTIFGDFADAQRKQIDVLVDEVVEQYNRDQNDMVAVINRYKKFLLNKQVLFTNESEVSVIYFKRRYMEKIDLLCSRFQMYNAEASAENRFMRKQKIDLFKKVIKDEFDFKLNQLKIEYSKKTIPLLDNFWHLEQNTGNKYALDEVELNKKLKDLKMTKNLGLKSLIESFEKEKAKLKEYFDKKVNLTEDINKLGVAEFDVYLKDLKEECEMLCCEIINMNARFWTKANAEFNCIARRYFVKLRHQYAPYVRSWRSGSKAWMNEYLQINLNQELLKAVGEALKGLSPEAELYQKMSNALLKFNEKVRSISVHRDNVEAEQLLLLNTLPKIDLKELEIEAGEKMNLYHECYSKFSENYKNFYNFLLTDGYEIKN